MAMACLSGKSHGKTQLYSIFKEIGVGYKIDFEKIYSFLSLYGRSKARMAIQHHPAVKWPRSARE